MIGELLEASTWSSERIVATLALTAPSCWWVCAVVLLSRADAALLFCNAVLVLVGCVVVCLFVEWCTKQGMVIFDKLSCTHYLQGVLSFVTYIILYAVGRDTFLKYWSSKKQVPMTLVS